MALANTQSTEHPEAGYACADVERARESLRTHLPALLALRMDRVHDFGTATTRLHLLVAGIRPNQPSRTLRVQCTSQRGWRGHTALASCLAPFQVSAASLATIEHAFDTLRGCNPFGAWAIAPEPATAAVLEVQAGTDVTDTARITPHGGSYLRDLVDELKELLPRIARIHADRAVERDTRGQRRRRTFLRFFDHQGRERAAIDAALLGVQLRTAIVPEHDPFTALNAQRQAWWEEQLQLDPLDLPVALHSLYLVFNTLPLDALVLGA